MADLYTVRPITLQSGIREFNQDISGYTGMLGGLTADIHTLRSLNPETTNRVMVVMYRGPYFMMKYLAPDGNIYSNTSLFRTYKKVLEYYNTSVTVNFGGRDLATTPIKGGFAGRQINIPTQQNAQAGQSITIGVNELVGRPITNFTNMWVDGIADGITGLTTYHGLVAGGINKEDGTYRQIFSTDPGLEPSPAWEVAEFLIIALDRSGARVEGAVAAIGCTPQAKIGQEIFTMQNGGNSQVLGLQLTFNCQLVESAYINDLASRYVKQFAVFGNSNNFNPGAGDAFFKDGTSSKYGSITSDMFNNGTPPTDDAVQSRVGNMPVFQADATVMDRTPKKQTTITTADHSVLYNGPDTNDYVPIGDPYATKVSGTAVNGAETMGSATAYGPTLNG